MFLLKIQLIEDDDSQEIKNTVSAADILCNIGHSALSFLVNIYQDVKYANPFVKEYIGY